MVSDNIVNDESGISKFIGAINSSTGLAKPNWFKVFITKPSLSNVERDVSLFCTAAQFPSNNILTSPIRTYGPPIEYPYMKIFDAVNLTFLVDNQMKVKNFFDNWMQLIVDDGVTNDVAFSDDYATTIDIYQLDQGSSGITHSISLLQAYPKLINAIQLDHQSQNQFHRLEVTFVYSKILYGIYENESPTINPQAEAPSSSNYTNNENSPFGAPTYDNSFGNTDFLGSSYPEVSNFTNQINAQVMNTFSPFMSPITDTLNNITAASSFLANPNISIRLY